MKKKRRLGKSDTIVEMKGREKKKREKDIKEKKRKK